MSPRTILSISLALSLVCLAPRAEAGGPSLAFPGDGAALAPPVVAQLRFLHGRGCRALALTPSERAAVEEAGRRVDRALADPALVALLVAKDDWRVDRAGRWENAPTAGAALVSAWRGGGEVSVIAYAAADDGGCGDEADPAVHALTALGTPVILLNARYLERRVHAPDAEAGLRDLTRTLAHELTHALGFSHHDDPGAVGLTAYNNTVPTFFGCAVSSWPDLGRVHGWCGLADHARADAPPASSCDAALGLTGLVPGAAVSVRFSERWLDARVREVDATRGRVAIDYGIAEVTPAWVDGCRVRRVE